MKSFWHRFLLNPRVTISLTWLTLVVVFAIFAPLVAPGDPFAIVDKPFIRPFEGYGLGTDSLGRNLYAGLAHGARTTLLIAVIATLAAVAFGTLVGAGAGFYGGLVDDLLMRVTEFFQTIPSFLFAIVLVAILSPAASSVVIAIATVSWPPIARVVRGEVLSVKGREFVLAAILAGQCHLRRGRRDPGRRDGFHFRLKSRPQAGTGSRRPRAVADTPLTTPPAAHC